MERKGKPAAPAPRLSSVDNAIRLINAFTDEDDEIGITELGKRLSLPKSTVHRLAMTLAEAGMLEQLPETGKYRLGLAFLELGSRVRRKRDLSQEAKPFLSELRDRTGETVHLSILDEANIVCINTLESRQAIRMALDVGMRKPAHATAAGKLMLAFQPAGYLDRLLASGLEGRTPNTIVEPEAFRRELTTIRLRGYAIADEENEIGVRSLATPVRNQSGQVIAATSIAGPAQRLTKKRLDTFVPDVIGAADAISTRLGYRPQGTG